MNLNYLECFASLSETLSFTETAKNFAVSQPSISRQIKLLEEQLNAKLFIRDKHRVHLTEEGIVLKQKITPMIKELHSVLKNTQERTNQLSGQIHFGSLPEIGQYAFMDMITSFQREFPDMSLYINYTTAQEIVFCVKNGKYDFGIINEVIDQENLRSYEILKEKSVLVTSYKNKNNLENIDEAKFVCYSDDDALVMSYIHKFHKRSSISKINRYIVVNSHKSMIDALKNSSFYAVMPYFSIEKSLKDKDLRIASTNELSNSLYLIHLDNNLMPKKNEQFKKHLMEESKKKKLP